MNRKKVIIMNGKKIVRGRMKDKRGPVGQVACLAGCCLYCGVRYSHKLLHQTRCRERKINFIISLFPHFNLKNLTPFYSIPLN